MSVAKENLDERIERIKRQTEEIEKKHREAEEDRLMALKMNALVTKSTLDDENWPKAHKYDELDFTYDVDPEKLEESNKAKEEEKLKPKRDYKKFAEGEGPPPDPKYNFLADNERDGIASQQTIQKNEKFKQNFSNNNNKNKDQFNKRGGSQNNSFRNGRGNNFSNNNKAQVQQQQSQIQNKSQNKLTQPEQWRNYNDKGVGEEIKSNLNRSQNQKSNEKWKREWDSDKADRSNFSHESHNNSNSNRSPKHTANKNISNYQNQQGNVQSHQHVHQSNSSQAEYMIEKRGNITVSVSQTGEVKSVKLSSAPPIGTGRVGPRQLSKPSFQVQTKTTMDNDVLSPQFKQNSNTKTMNMENQEISNNNLTKNTGATAVNVEKYSGSQNCNTDLQKLQIQNLLQQQQQLLSQEQQQQNLQAKYSLNPEVPKLSQNHLLQQSKQELLIQKQREQMQQKMEQQQYLQLQRQKDQESQFCLAEQQKYQQIKNQQQDQLKQQYLIQQLHQQQQKELMQQRQNLLKQQKQQHQNSQTLTTPAFDNNKQSNELDKTNARQLITKSPKKDRKIFKNNFVSKNDLPPKILNSQVATVGVLQMTENSNSQNIATTVIDTNVFDTVAKELSAKPEFAKKSVQDRLLRIRQNSNTSNLNSSNSEGANDNNDFNTKMNLSNVDSNNELTESETIVCK